MPSQPPTSIGRYQIIRVLGEGGMGSVYLAKDPEIDRFVAIKLLRSGLDDSLRERFRREARAIGQLHHINIVMVFDVGEHQGSPFFAMEYIEGQTLQQIVRSGGPVSLSNTLHWIEGLCSGLHYAHRRGIVHRDIKPANLVIDDENRLKILDFGIARGMAPGMTQAGMLIGTPNYMSPEQIAGKPIDHRSDTFAVGAVFYEVLTGKQAFPGDIRTGILQKILNSQHVPVGLLVPAIPEAVAAVVERCLGKEPEERYPDLETMRKDVVAAATRVTRGDTDGATVVARAARTPADDATRAELLRQRRERIDQHIARARAALAARDLVSATDACTQALILDPELAEAFDLQERIQRLQHARRLVEEAQTELSRGAVTMASSLVERASGVDPEMPEVARLREQVDAERRRREERARQLLEVVARGRAALEKERLDVARAAVDEVIAAEPGHAEAAALAQAIDERLAARRRAEEETARARELVARARQRFGAGEYDAAIEMLRAHTPTHAVVDSARAALEMKRREILRRQEEERRIEAERQAERERREAQKRADDERRRVEEQRRQEERQRAEEERRRADEQRRIEAERRAEEKRKRDEEARARAEEERRLEEQRRRAAEEQRLEAERRAQEERARETEARRVEEARRAEEEEETRRRAAEAAAAASAASDADADADAERTLVLTTAEVEELRGDLPPAESPAPPTAEPPPPVEPVVPAAAEPPSEPAVARAAAGVAPASSGVAGAPAARRVPDVPPAPRAELQKRSRPALSPVAIAGVAAAVILVIAAIVWFATRDDGPVVTTPATVAVLIDVRPWAALESIVTRADSRPVDAPCPATPCVVNLAPGEYRVRARNPFFQNPLEFDLTVAAGSFQEARHSLPDLNPEEEVRRLFGGGSQ